MKVICDATGLVVDASEQLAKSLIGKGFSQEPGKQTATKAASTKTVK